MPESVTMSVTTGQAVSTVPAAVESSGARAPGAPAVVRGTGALTRWYAPSCTWSCSSPEGDGIPRCGWGCTRSAPWVILFLGGTAVILAVGGLSNDTVGRHLTYLFLFGMFVAVGPPLLAAYGGTTSLPVLAMWGMAICFMVGGLAGIGAQVALSAMPRQEVLAGGLGLIAALSAVGLGTSWWGGRRIYLRQDH